MSRGSKELAPPRTLAILIVAVTWLCTSHPGFADPSSTMVSEEDFRQLSGRLATLEERLRQTRQATERMQQATASLDIAADDAPSAAAQGLVATRALIERERQILADLVAANSQLPETLSLAELERRQRDSEEERDELAKKLADLEDGGGDQGTGLQASKYVSDKQIFPLVVTRGRIVPGMEPYYSIAQVPCVNRQTKEELICNQTKRVRDGTAVVEAIKEGGFLDLLIEDHRLSPETHVFQLLVCSDSVTSFHRLRQAIKQRGFSFAWDTFRDRTILSAPGAQAGRNGTWVY